jgi:hypothetical protein
LDIIVDDFLPPIVKPRLTVEKKSLEKSYFARHQAVENSLHIKSLRVCQGNAAHESQ